MADKHLPVIEGGHTNTTVTEAITSVILTKPTPKAWIMTLPIALTLAGGVLMTIFMLLVVGVGIWGINIPVGWGMDILNFVWWIGIGHAGTLISAILLLLKQKWRMSISRFSEAMTLFAVACAGLYPIFHTGRPWRAFYLFPYPNTMALWPQFRSPLVWDVFAVSTYATVSLLFWYVGLIPDLATMRDKAKNFALKRIYGVMSLGWRGSAVHWGRYETACLLLAGLATPLVVSVHTIVSFDFAVSVLPGWHTTIFPPYFVAGAIYSGFAMVLTLVIPIRAIFGMKDFITEHHLNNMAKVMLATGLIVAYGYAMEVYLSFYSANKFEIFMILNRMGGPCKWYYWALILCNVLTPQLLWFRAVRLNVIVLFAISIVVNIGMWLERYVIIVISLHRDFVPSSWGMYHPTFWDWAMFIGTIGMFLTFVLLFIKSLPMIAMFEMKMILPKKDKKGSHAH
jgi:Ni/Fe-hydrogenase subunit HybB-like protein